ncbi:ribosomal protein L7/L12 [Fodinicola feengrottensis]|uniref:Ribosomal protein L7/L12 C-terminal domain-containing protein n=1 Tax=Fodinicola feengrottensis TaxID=435914 RepID=A0ABN2GX23_9ACTN|nr:ribosomal protein L7/L12 [Fodinicola feengrottensis]
MTGLYIAIGVIAVLVLAWILLRSSKSSRSARPPARELQDLPIDSAALTAIYASLGANKRVLAIKQLRQATGLGLADAKYLTEAIAAGHRPPERGIGLAQPSLADRARGLRRQGREADAIRLVRDETGMGDPEAAKFVRSLD